MGFFDTVLTNIKGALNDAADAAANPAVEARQRIRDLEDSISRANSEMVNVEAEYRVLTGKIANEEKIAKEYKEKAGVAVDKGRDDLAKEALQRTKDATEKANSYRVSADKMKPMIEHLKLQIKNLETRKREMQTSAETMQARLSVADAQEKAANILDTVGTASKGGDFSKLEEKVAKREARAGVRADQVNESTGKRLDDELAALGDTSVDDELAALKASRNK